MESSVITTAPPAHDLSAICIALHRIAQKHVSTTAFADINELLHISKILEANDVPVETAVKLKAAVDDHIPAVAKQSADYRLLRAQFRAALSTIADLGRRDSKTHKSEFHEGVHAGLRKAAKIAIIFLDDLNDNTVWANSPANSVKTTSRLVR
jgi:hypothetical protein